MLDEMRPLLMEAKVSSLLGGLRDKKKKQLIATEVELGLLWGIKQVAEVQVNPSLPNSTRVPDTYDLTPGLVPFGLGVCGRGQPRRAAARPKCWTADSVRLRQATASRVGATLTGCAVSLCGYGCGYK